MTGPDAPLVSIIVPVYNASRWLEACLTSCRRQTHRELDVVLVDDGSTDDSAAICSRFVSQDRRFRYFSQPNRGHSAARNRGLRESAGAYVLYLDSDDELLECAVESLLAGLHAAGADAAVADWINFYPDGSEQTVSARFFLPEDPLASWLEGCNVASSALLLKDDTTWNETMKVNEGARYFFDYFLRHPDIAYVPRAVTRIRQHDSPQRMSMRYRHFHPVERFLMYASFADALQQKGMLNRARKAVLDYHMLTNLYQSRLQGLPVKPEYFARLSGLRLGIHPRYKRFGMTGWAQALGARRGIEAFLAVNRLLGRA